MHFLKIGISSGMLLKPRWHGQVHPQGWTLPCTSVSMARPHGGYEGAITPPLSLKDGPRDSLQTKAKLSVTGWHEFFGDEKCCKITQFSCVAKTSISAHANMESGDAS